MKLSKILVLALAAMMLLVGAAFADIIEDDAPAAGPVTPPIVDTNEPVICTHPWTIEADVSSPTCDDQGSVTHICGECGDIVFVVTTEALGHNFVELISATDPTCEKDGAAVFGCSHVGCTETLTVINPALGHMWNMIAEELPTCTKDGYVNEKCLRCDNYRSYTPDTHKALGHNMVEIDRENPTCTKDGWIEQECTRCQKIDIITDPALGHNWTNWTIQQKPTCTQDGIKTRYCTRPACYDAITLSATKETIVIKAHGHELNTAQATVNADGSKVGPCLYCKAPMTVPAPAPVEPETTPDTETKPENKPSTPNTNGGNSSSSSTSGVEIPATGDASIAWAYIMVAASAIVLVAMKKRATNN